MTTPAGTTPEAPEGTPPAGEAGKEGSKPEGEVKAAAKSLLDGAGKPPEGEKPEGEKPGKSLIEGEAAKWHYADGAPGVGEPPEWFKAAKYKTVEEQAKAYVDLESRFGAFVGAPKDGVYDFKLPEGVVGELDAEHPLLKGFNEWAVKKQINQESYNDLLGMLATYEAALQPDMGEVLKRVGPKADERIATVQNWAKANLDVSGFGLVRDALAGSNADVVFKAIEAVVAKTKQPVLPKPGQDVEGAGKNRKETILAAQAARGPDGQRLYETDALHRAKVEKMWQDLYATEAA